MAKILIVDDEKNIAGIFQKAVESMGHIAIKSRNGRIAWDVLSDNPEIKLLITDFAMPEMDGEELIGLIRKDNYISGIPILIVSGVMRAKDISNLLKEGATAFLPKPVIMKDLKQFINKYIS
ncbi:MAG: response regulator [Deltaproteobacteria bacterium]|nr:response regulator [Deltaproteobacteria bacterium]